MEQPRVTVGLPVYNDPGGLRRTVPSVLGQTWKGSLRLLVVDDGSTDETSAVLASLAEQDSRVEVVTHRINHGRPIARNKILEHAGDDYLAWIDSGDLWYPRKLDLQVPTLLDEEARDPITPLLCTGPLRWIFIDRSVDTVRIPDVTGDQLYKALVGSLYPYLQGMLGRAQHFREVGGFDELLFRRQDYDFLVRFVGEGGRIVSTPSHTPLWTYLKSDVGASTRIVVESNRLILKKHQPYYRLYGRRLVRQVRSNQYRLAGRLHVHNGRTLRGYAFRIFGMLSHPEPMRTAGRSAKRAALSSPASLRLLTRRLAALLLPLLPILRRAGVAELGRRLGILRLPAAARVMRVVHDEARSIRDEAGSSVLPVTDQTADLPSALAQTEAAVDASQPGSGSVLWLRLEQSFRERGLLHSAQVVLEKALEHNPNDVELCVRLVELLGLRRKWQACVDVWSSLEEIDERDKRARGITYVRVARSLRALGDPVRALTVAEEGVRRWPHEIRAWEEVYVSRSALVDWQRAIVGAAPAIPFADDTIGVVTDLGFLLGADRPISGWILLGPQETRSVSLVVNGTPVASTCSSSIDRDDDRCSFSISCHDLRLYLGDGDIISVECDGEPLTIEGYGARCEVSTGYASRCPELMRKIESGYVFTKFGELREGNTPTRRRRVLALYDRVSEILEQTHDYPAFPFYGNLLGAVREHGLIGHDIGGFDMGYISRHHRPESVRTEFLDICRILLDRGYHLRLEPWSVYIRSNHNDRYFVDLNYAWFNQGGELNFSYGWRFQPVEDQQRFFYPRECPIGDHLVRIPGNSEDVLQQLYGPTWAVPDQGFELSIGLRRDPAFLLTIDEMLSLEALDPDRVDARLNQHPNASEIPRFLTH